MITVQKTYGVQGVEDDITLVRIQELIALSKQQFGWVGKAIIDPEKITFYKFGLKLGISRLATNGLVVNECGIIRNVGLIIPEVHDMQVLRDVYELFGKRLPY
jgi:hypothetical protein